MVSIIQVNGTGRSANMIQHKRLALMPPQILIQGVVQFQALQNIRVDIGLSCEDNTFLKKEASWLIALTNTIMAALDTLLGVVKIGFIIYKLAKNTN